GRCFGERDLVAEALQSTDEVVGDALLVELIQVSVAQVLVVAFRGYLDCSVLSTGSCGGIVTIVTIVAAICSWPSHANRAACARAAMLAGCATRRRIQWTACSRRCPCGNGCSRFPSKYGNCVPFERMRRPLLAGSSWTPFVSRHRPPTPEMLERVVSR